MSRDCDKARTRFLALEDATLGTEDATRVCAHLAECGECRRAWQEWQADGRLLGEALRPVEVPRDVAGAVVAQLRSGAARPRIAVQRRWVLVGGLAAAAAVLLALGALLLFGKRYEQIGRVASAEGQPLARQRGARYASPIAPGAPIYDGDELIADGRSQLEVGIDDGSRLTMRQMTELLLHSGQSRRRPDCGLEPPHVCLHEGEVVIDLKSTRRFCAVGTPLGTAFVRGTRFRMKYVNASRALLEVFEGEVIFSCPKGEARVTPGGIWVVDGAEGIPKPAPDLTWN